MRSFIQNLQIHYLGLRKSEKKIADYLQEHADERLELSITELARTLEISETTVSRFCKSIGYRGFQDLKLSLAASAATTEAGRQIFKNIPQEINEQDTPVTMSTKLSDSLQRSLVQTQAALNMGQVEAAIQALAGAQQIMLYGIGGSAVIVLAAHHLFTKAGLNCVAYTDGYMQAVSASMLKAVNVVIGVSNTGMSKHVVDAVKIAAQNGAQTISITGNRDSNLAKASQICLVTPLAGLDAPLYGGSIDAKVSQLYLIDLLYLGVLFKLGDPAKRNLEQTAQVLRTYYNPKFSSPPLKGPMEQTVYQPLPEDRNQGRKK